MALNNELLNRIYDKTDGCCHLCHRKLSFVNYGKKTQKGAWQIEHSIPKAKGGSNHLNNLFPACIRCNIEKGVRHTNVIRRRNNISRAPYSKKKKELLRDENVMLGMLSGGIVGTRFGPAGVLLCSLLGGALGEHLSSTR